LKFLACLVEEERNVKFLLASLKASKSCSENRIKFLVCTFKSRNKLPACTAVQHDVTEESRNFSLDFLHKKTAKNVKPISDP
jgi:hypothetical protein